MACAPPRTWLFACWKPGAISPYLLKKCSPCPTALTRSVLTPHELHWRTGRAGSPGKRYGPGSPDTHPDRYAVPRSVVTAYWKSTEEAVPIMPRLSEGRAFSPLKIHQVLQTRFAHIIAWPYMDIIFRERVGQHTGYCTSF